MREPQALPTLAEVREWDRDHRRECQERHCTLDHRMLAFADWYIAIEQGYEKRVRSAERTRLRTAVDEMDIVTAEVVDERTGQWKPAQAYERSAVLALLSEGTE